MEHRLNLFDKSAPLRRFPLRLAAMGRLALALAVVPGSTLAAGEVPAAAPSGEVVLEKRQRELMYTLVTVGIADPLPGGEREAAFEAAFAVFAEIDSTMNEWKPDSALGRINSAAGGEPVSAPPKLCEVLRLSLDGARRTGGLFDPTWAALRGVWKFGEQESPVVPSRKQVKEACRLVSWREVEVTGPQGAPCTVRLKRAGMKLGLGGVVKGWGVDQAVSTLRARGLKNFFVQAGGDLYLAGKNGERPWRAGIRDPRGPPDQTFASLEVSDSAFSTSGDYEHFFIQDGVRYHHLIDPRSCYPASVSRSATVLAKSATDAEILTKAAFILGGTKALALAESFGAGLVVAGSEGKVHSSKSLRAKLKLKPRPDR